MILIFIITLSLLSKLNRTYIFTALHPPPLRINQPNVSQVAATTSVQRTLEAFVPRIFFVDIDRQMRQLVK